MNWIKVKDMNCRFDNCIYVECIAEIRNNETGEIREYHTKEILELGNKHPSVFNWEVNNYACDCNRRIFFNRSKNEDIDKDWDVECSDGKFSVNLKNKADGKIYYQEF